MKNVGITVIACILALVAAELGIRALGWEHAHGGKHDLHLKAAPNEFMKADPVLGWRVAAGHFYFHYNTDKPYFDCNVTANGERFIPGDTCTLPNRKKIHLYGCSYTFGFSVADTQQLGYYLQQILPLYKVQNKGVPGYNFVQEYLALRESVAMGDTPSIAVLNLTSFSDHCSPFYYGWCREFRFGMEHAKEKNYTGFPYPYISADTIALMPYREFPEDWPWRSRSAIVDMINTLYDRYHDNKQEDILLHNTIITLKLFSDYCITHNIKLVMAGFNDRTEKTLASVPGLHADIINYNVDFGDTAFNCAPADPNHPNARAHLIFAEKIAGMLQKGD